MNFTRCLTAPFSTSFYLFTRLWVYYPKNGKTVAAVDRAVAFVPTVDNPKAKAPGAAVLRIALLPTLAVLGLILTALGSSCHRLQRRA